MTAMTKVKGLATAASFAATLLVGGVTYASAEEVTLTMAVPDWPPTRIMKKFFDEQYKPKSGNTVKLDVDFIPWPDFYTRVNASLTSGEKKYNFIVSDSQWLGAFVEGGYFRKINDLIDADPELKATMESMHPAVLNAYSTYPNSTPNYYGFPQFPDVLVTYGRKDVLCNDDEQAAFKAKYSTPWTGTPSSMLANSSSARRATSSPARCWMTISTASPIRQAKATTSRRARSTRSSGSMAAASGMKPRPRPDMPKAS
jgi:multiple sugar transport system substrate-binding protein